MKNNIKKKQKKNKSIRKLRKSISEEKFNVFSLIFLRKFADDQKYICCKIISLNLTADLTKQYKKEVSYILYTDIFFIIYQKRFHNSFVMKLLNISTSVNDSIN